MNVSHQVSFSRTTVKKIGDRACQRDMGQSYPFISVLVLITRVIWSFYCSRVFKVILHGYSKKNLQFVSTLFKSTSYFKEVKKRWSIFKIGFWTSKQPFATNFLPSLCNICNPRNFCAETRIRLLVTDSFGKKYNKELIKQGSDFWQDW